MKEVLSGSPDGQIKADSGEVESKFSYQGPTDAVATCSSWTDEKHMMYLSSLEESFVNQLHSSQFRLHFMNLLGQSRRNQRQSDSSITTESLSDTSRFKTLQKGRWKDLKFRKTKSGVQKENILSDLSVNPWIRHFAPSSRGNCVDTETCCQVVDHQSFSATKSIKRECCCNIKESISQARSSFSSHDCSACGEVSDQNFVNKEITGVEMSQTNKRKRLSSPIPPPIYKVVPRGKSNRINIKEEG